MTDHELLELAAKAVGFGGTKHEFCWTESEYPRHSGQHGALWNYIGHMDTAVLWNPLTDDGDALRLAVKLGMGLDVLHGSGISMAYVHGKTQARESHGSDMWAATRRAIVHAAAKLSCATKEA